MTTKRTPTEEMADELREAEDVMGVLDQRAIANGPALSRTYHRMYQELQKLAEHELKEWNSDASCGLRDVRRILYRCDESAMPYHTQADDGPCEVYTPNWDANWDASKGQGPVSICDTCKARLAKEGK